MTSHTPASITAALEQAIEALTNAPQSSIALTEYALQAVVDYIGQDLQRLKDIGTTPNAIRDVVKILQLVEQSSMSAVTLPTAAKATLAAYGLAAIAKLCRFSEAYDSRSEENVDVLGYAGACEAVVSTLNAHMIDPEVVKKVRMGLLIFFYKTRALNQPIFFLSLTMCVCVHTITSACVGVYTVPLYVTSTHRAVPVLPQYSYNNNDRHTERSPTSVSTRTTYVGLASREHVRPRR
jgi:hypothetical protein